MIMPNDVYSTLKERGFVDQISSDDLKEMLKNPLSFYLGFDPTADSLHVGHLVGIVAITWLKKFGHKPNALIGGATGGIGDPSWKSKERVLLSEEELEKNISSINQFFQKILDHDGDSIIINNNDWYNQMSLVPFLRDVGKYFRLGPMLGKESVRLRLDSEEGMSFTEFSYQLLQGYDFYHLYKNNNVVLQLGGSDQWGNITAGIDLTRKILGKTVYGMTFPLLTKSDGKKFGKTESGAVWLNEKRLSAYEFYQYFYRSSDIDVIKLLKMLTFLDINEINSLEKQMTSSHYQPNTVQKVLAKEVTQFVHGDEALNIAIETTQKARPGSLTQLDKKTLETLKNELPHVECKKEDVIGKKYTEIAALIKLVNSKSEATRLIKNSGAYLNNKKVEDINYIIKNDDLIENVFLLFGSGKKKKMIVSVK
jgi:tyrosyl-tRNA synthetase